MKHHGRDHGRRLADYQYFITTFLIWKMFMAGQHRHMTSQIFTCRNRRANIMGSGASIIDKKYKAVFIQALFFHRCHTSTGMDQMDVFSRNRQIALQKRRTVEYTVS